MALAAVSTDTITLDQAAAMVIGMNVGTTATAALATIGGNVHARRTGFAHVIYNLLTAVIAFLLLTPFMSCVEAILPGARASDPELVLAGFHTFMNTVGVIAILPFTKQFARLILRIVPARGNPLIRQLDRSLFADPDVAIGAVEGTLWQITQTLLGEVQRLLRDPSSRLHERTLNQLTEAIEETNKYMEESAANFKGTADLQDYLASVHVLDHLRRIESRVREESRLRRCRHDEGLARMSDKLLSVIEIFLQSTYRLSREQAEKVQTVNQELKSAMRTYRLQVIETTAEGKMKTKDVLHLMDTARTLRRIGYHLWRIARHLAEPEMRGRGENADAS
jgi:phosphate:Na+ symporter